MAHHARTIVASGSVVGCAMVLVAGGCGFHGAGALDLPAEAAALVMADGALADASSDTADDPVVLDVQGSAEGAPPPGPCDDPTLVLCVRFDGATPSPSPSQGRSPT